MGKKNRRTAGKGANKRALALQQAAAMLLEAKAIGELANAPNVGGAELITRAFGLIDSIAQLRAQNPKGLVTADEIQALMRGAGDVVH